MEEGLDVGISQFNKMSSKDRDSVMFQNMVHLRGMSKNNRLDKRIQYVWLICLTGIIGIKRIFGL